MCACAVWFEASRKEGPLEDMFFFALVHAFDGIGGCPSILVTENLQIGFAVGIKKLSAALLANSFD
jgi:hypothetical protein